MASQGPNSGSTFASDAGIGTIAWTNPGNAASSNNTYATADISDAEITQYLKATGFGFSIPVGATINGIIVSIERKRSKETTDHAVRLVKAGVIQATDRSTATIYTSTDVSEDHGSSVDLWGDSWSHSDINDAGFGAAFSCIDTEEAGSGVASCDWIGITVHYTEGGGATIGPNRCFDLQGRAISSITKTSLIVPVNYPVT